MSEVEKKEAPKT
jgi:ribonuclease E